jgi:hypothetical protein
VLPFEFRWDDVSHKAKLEARARGNSVTLEEDQPAGDPKSRIIW